MVWETRPVRAGARTRWPGWPILSYRFYDLTLPEMAGWGQLDVWAMVRRGSVNWKGDGRKRWGADMKEWGDGLSLPNWAKLEEPLSVSVWGPLWPQDSSVTVLTVCHYQKVKWRERWVKGISLFCSSCYLLNPAEDGFVQNESVKP